MNFTFTTAQRSATYPAPRSTVSPAASRADLEAATRQLDLFQPGRADSAVSVRRSRRARRLSVHVLPHGLVEVVAPWRTPPREVEAFIAASRGWIDKTLSRISRDGPAATVALPDLIDLRACGGIWRVEYLSGEPRLRVLHEGPHGGRLRVTIRDPEARRQLRDWLLRQGRRILPRRVERIAETIGLRPDAVSVRRQRTRWGSCSARRRISLNCALLFLPVDLVDYLIVHELCHLRHMNHSRRFWSLVESIRPDSRARERALSRAWTRVPGWVFYEA